MFRLAQSLVRRVSIAAAGGVLASAGFVFVATDAVAQPASASAPSASGAAAQPGPKPLAEALEGSAKKAYDSAKLLVQDGDPASALVKFREAYEASKEPRLLWNIAACEKQLRHYAKTRQQLAQYLREGGNLLTESERSQAQAAIAALEGFITAVSVTVNERGASVEIDNEPAGQTPLDAPVLVDMGKRSVRVTKSGFSPHSETLTAPGGGKLAVDVRLVAVSHEGSLRVAADAGATVKVDGRAVGVAPWEGKVPSGNHSIVVSAAGKRTYESQVQIQDDQVNSLSVTLQDQPKGPLLGIPTWAWIAGGTVAVAGLGVGGYFLFKPRDAEPTPTTPGSLGQVELLLGR
jgi:hypothetical protein